MDKERIGLVKIPAEKITEVRDRLDIERVIGRTVKLQRKGTNLMGCCPFHQEKTPSFSVDSGKKLFHCFGCGEGGDVFAFVMKQDNVDFPEAVRTLAQEVGVELPQKEESPAEKKSRVEKERMYRVNQLSSNHFEAQLAKNEAALSYLRNDRGLTDETINDFHLGYAPDAWDQLSNDLARRNVPEKIAVQLGLLGRKSRGDGVYDRFRGKVIFPINSVKGDVSGFGARRADWLNKEDDGPKYLNSIDSLVYDKSRLFYGIDRAKNVIRKERSAIIVEGYFDVIALHQAGIKTAIACCGTSISKYHAQALQKLQSEVITAYDGDEAGQRATRRAAELLLQSGLKVRVLKLPKGDDPDTFVTREGADALRALLDNCPSAIDAFLEQAISQNQGGGVAGLVEIVNDIRPLLMAIANPADRELYIQGVAHRLNIDARQLARRLAQKQQRAAAREQRSNFVPQDQAERYRPQAEQQEAPSPAQRNSKPKPIPVTEKTVLRQLVTNPSTVLPELEKADIEEAIQHPGVRAAFHRARKLGVHFDAHHALEAASEVCHPQEIAELRKGLMTQLPNEDELSPCIDQILRKYHRDRLAVLKKRIAQESNPEVVQTLMAEAESLRVARQMTGSKFSHAK